jgi:hypothetical protein
LGGCCAGGAGWWHVSGSGGALCGCGTCGSSFTVCGGGLICCGGWTCGGSWRSRPGSWWLGSCGCWCFLDLFSATLHRWWTSFIVKVWNFHSSWEGFLGALKLCLNALALDDSASFTVDGIQLDSSTTWVADWFFERLTSERWESAVIDSFNDSFALLAEWSLWRFWESWHAFVLTWAATFVTGNNTGHLSAFALAAWLILNWCWAFESLVFTGASLAWKTLEAWVTLALEWSGLQVLVLLACWWTCLRNVRLFKGTLTAF